MRALPLLFLILSGCALLERKPPVVTIRMDVLCAPVAEGLACADLQTWREYLESQAGARGPAAF
jgi:hypothetical protein